MLSIVENGGNLMEVKQPSDSSEGSDGAEDERERG
jgi:hypothetical protein